MDDLSEISKQEEEWEHAVNSLISLSSTSEERLI